MRDPAGPRIAWPGVRVIARFEGTEATVRLAEDASSEGPSRFDVVIDGKTSGEPLSVTGGEAAYELATGLATGVHTVELHRITEARAGITQVRGFDFGGGKLLPPAPASSRRLEFLGDSTSNGYGIDGTAPCSFSGATQNEGKSYPALVAKALGAEYVHLAYSGKGVLQNYVRSDDELFPELYRRAVPTDASSLWSFPLEAPAVVFINLGGNDWEQSTDAFDPPDVDAFAAKYGDLLRSIRAKYPSAHLIAALGPSQTDEHPEGFEAYTKGKQALQLAVEALGDGDVSFFEPSRLTDEFRTGCDGHPNAAFHERLSVEIAAEIKRRAGW